MEYVSDDHMNYARLLLIALAVGISKPSFAQYTDSPNAPCTMGQPGCQTSGASTTPGANALTPNAASNPGLGANNSSSNTTTNNSGMPLNSNGPAGSGTVNGNLPSAPSSNVSGSVNGSNLGVSSGSATGSTTSGSMSGGMGTGGSAGVGVGAGAGRR